MKYKCLATLLAMIYLCSSVLVFASSETTTQETESTTQAQEADTSGIKTDKDRGTSLVTTGEDGLELVSEGAVLMEASTGQLLYSKNAEEKFYPASITKIMTTLVALENGNLSDSLTFSADTLNSIEADSSRVGVEADETMTLESALYCVMLVSGNDAAAGVAEYIGKTVDGFVDMMNAKVEELGCVNTHFTNPHGLHNENHYTCAADMALIMKAATDIPDFCKIASAKTYTVPKTNKSETRELWNHHKMLLPASEYHYEGVAEGKTGYTSDAWNTLVTAAEKDGMKLIAISLRCQGAAAAYSDTSKMFDYGFDNHTLLKPLENLSLESAAENSGISVGEISNLNKLSPAYNKNYTILAPKTAAAEDILVSLAQDGSESGVWGSFHFTYQDKEIGSANVYYDATSDHASILEEDNSTEAKVTSKLPFVLTGVIILLILFIIALVISIIKRK